MKKVYRILALALMLLMLSGCGSGSGGQIIGGNSEQQDSYAKIQYVPEKLKHAGNLPVVKWVCLTDDYVFATRGISGKDHYKEDVIVSVNKYLRDIGAGFQLQFVFVSGLDDFVIEGQGIMSLEDWFTDSGVQAVAADADLLFANFSAARMQEYLEPISAEVQSSLENAVPHAFLWQRTTLDGEVYGISSESCMPSYLGWYVDAKVMDTYGMTVEDFQQEYWEMDAVFEELHQQHGGSLIMISQEDSSMPVVAGSDFRLPENAMDNLATFKPIVACYAIDSSGDKPTVVNILETERMKAIRSAKSRYLEAGYTCLDTDPNARYLISYSSVPNDEPVLRNGQWQIPVGKPFINTRQMFGQMTGIAKNSERKEEALAVLKLLAEDETFRRLLCFGQEGENYTLENGIGNPTKKGWHYLGYLTPMSDFSGMNTQEWTMVSNQLVAAEGENSLTAYEQLVEKSYILCPLDFSYGFDLSGLVDEVKAVNGIVQSKSENFIKLTPEEYETWMQEIREAGGDVIQAELQRQLDEWLAQNPGWE